MSFDKFTKDNFAIEELIAKRDWSEANEDCILAICLSKNNPILEQTPISLKLLDHLHTHYRTVYILICDSIAVHEKLISKGTSYSKALQEVETMVSNVKAYISSANFDNVEFILWKEIENTLLYKNQLEKIRRLIWNDDMLADKLTTTADYYIKKRNSEVSVNPYRLYHFSEYILKELVVQFYGITKGDKTVKLLFHPVYIHSKEEIKTYKSPILDLKSDVIKKLSCNDKKSFAYTLRMYVNANATKCK